MTPDKLAAVLAAHKRVAIVGPPRTGKSTLASQVKDRPVIATDDTKRHPWADQPGITIKRAEGHERCVIEGVQVARALRKGLQVDAIVVLDAPHETLNDGQRRMSKGHAKILADALAMNPGVVVYREGE